MPAIPALGLYELPQIELPRNWLDIFAPLPAPRPPAPAPGLDAPIQYDQLPALSSGHRKMLQQPGYGQQARFRHDWLCHRTAPLATVVLSVGCANVSRSTTALPPTRTRCPTASILQP